MTSSDELRARIVAAIADGEAVDWSSVRRAGLLSPQELRALEVLERWRPPARGAEDGARQADASAAAALETGFELLDEIGRGTTARVWRARDKALEREVALKLLREDLAVPEHARQRFVQEARALAALRHPNVVGIHAIGEQAGRLYLSLELIRGASLESLVRERGRLAPEEAARIGIDLCRALAALHAHGLVHRDVKPGNVMREDGGRIVLLDFSLARSVDVVGHWDAGSFAGTPMFMAPEQFEGRESIGPSADVYGLGALLYWLVAGRPAFEGDSFAAVKQRVLAGAATPLVDVRADVPQAFARIVERALHRDPGQRHGSVGELERELREFVGSRESSSRGAAPRVPRYGWMLLAVIAVAAAVWLGVHRLGRSPLPQLECTLQQRVGRLAVPLADGDEIGVGDQLFLRARASRDAHVYVLDVDARGQMFVLFPLPGFELANPLAGGVEHELPGKLAGQVRDWQVTSPGGGAEWIVIAAAAQPLDDLEALVRATPPARPDAPLQHVLLDDRQRTSLLRGIGGTAAATSASPVSTDALAGAAIVDELARLGAAFDARAWVRVLRLRARD